MPHYVLSIEADHGESMCTPSATTVQPTGMGDSGLERTADLQAALADLQLANQLKDEFMAMISHELRTPLAGILSLSQMLTEQVIGPLNDRQIYYVKGIEESGERLLNVVNEILNYTHLISGKVQLRWVACALAQLLDTCARSQQGKANAKAQTIAVCVEPAVLAIIGDANAMADVLKRLLDNAIKFTPKGGQIGLEAHPTPAPAAPPAGGSSSNAGATFVDLVVWDTGVGIDQTQLAHIVKPFTQADARLARSYEGIGLGLAYVHQMVILLGGTLSVQSAPGQGSRFTITLPAQP
ncbi:MAG: HAMP domain-containing sensor histidine kinase [Caldilineaceae bacterium]